MNADFRKFFPAPPDFPAAKRLTGILAVLVSLLVATSAPAQQQSPPGQTELKAEITRLVRQLNAPQSERRDAAERELLELGPAVLGILPEKLERLPAEIKTRLTRVRQTLELRRSRDAVSARKLALDGAFSLGELLQQIEEQSGNRLIDAGATLGGAADSGKIELAIERQDYWPALDRILDKADLSLDHFSSRNGTVVRERYPDEANRFGSACYRGAFRLEAVETVATRNLREPSGNLLKLTLEVAWEPRLAPIAVKQELSDITAVDQRGEPLKMTSADASIDLPIQSKGGATLFELPFALPDPETREIARLRGKLTATVPGSVEKFEFREIESADRMEQRKGGARVTLDAVRHNNQLWQVFLRLAFEEASGALETHRDWVYYNPCYVLDSGGNKIESAGLELTSQSEQQIGIAYLFNLPDGPEGVTLVYTTPASIVRLPLEYELTNIPLP